MTEEHENGGWSEWPGNQVVYAMPQVEYSRLWSLPGYEHIKIAPAALSATRCAPTTQQPTSLPIAITGQVAGCPNLFTVAGGPGITLYVSLEQLRGYLPEVQQGEG